MSLTYQMIDGIEYRRLLKDFKGPLERNLSIGSFWTIEYSMAFRLFNPFNINFRGRKYEI